MMQFGHDQCGLLIVIVILTYVVGSGMYVVIAWLKWLFTPLILLFMASWLQDILFL